MTPSTPKRLPPMDANVACVCVPSKKDTTNEGAFIERDYLSEAFRIIAGDTMLLAQREHLIALQDHSLRSIEQMHQRALDIIGGKP